MVTATVWLVVGCASSHSVDASPRDAGASGDAACHIGPYPTCAAGCVCPESTACHPSSQICYGSSPENTIEGCYYSHVDDRQTYCPDGLICAASRTPSPGNSLGGACVEAAYCDEVLVSGETLGLEVDCQYSDGTAYVEGPPASDACPPSNPRGPLCGTSCDERACPYVTPERRWGTPSNWEISCVGLNEDRGVGACSPSGWWCTPFRKPLFTLSEFFGEPFLCLNFMVDGRYQDHAWPVFADTCRQYADLYPEDVRCIDDDWNTVIP